MTPFCRSLAAGPLVFLCALSCPTATADTPSAPAILEPVPAAYARGVGAIEAADLRAWIAFLASSELEGRESGRHGYDVAARYCATVLERYGARGAGDEIDADREGGERRFLQRFDLVYARRDDKATRVEVRAGEKSESFKGRDFGTHSTSSFSWKGPWALVDLSGAAKNADVTRALSEAGLADHIPIVIPPEKSLQAAQRGRPDLGKLGLGLDSSRAVIVSNHWARRANVRRYQPGFLVKPAPPVVYISERVADRALTSYGTSVKKLRESTGNRPVGPLEELELRVEVKTEREVRPTANVAALIPGASPELESEIVAVGAHLDHIGNESGKIHFGADDNASGTAGVLALAKAFHDAEHRPKRSVLLLLFGAEERGLFGSHHFVEHATVPTDKIVTYLNLDMIGRDADKFGERAAKNRNSVYLVASERVSTEYHEFIVDRNRMVGLEFKTEQKNWNLFRRSDHFHFAEKGIPVAFFFTGFHDDYHGPTDTREKINYPKMTRIVQLAYLVAHGVADLPARPRKARWKRF